MTIEEAEKFFKSFACSWFYIDRETGRECLNELNIPEELYDKWTWEYIGEKLDKLDFSRSYLSIISDLRDYVGYKLSTGLVERIYDIFIFLYYKTTTDKIKLSKDITKEFLIRDFHYYLDKEIPFGGILGYLYKDKEKVKTLSNILLDFFKSEDENDFECFKLFALYNLYYGLDYSSELHKLFVDKGKEEFEYSIEYGQYEWLILCYLDGYVVEKDYINAYRALRISYEKYNEISDRLIANIEFVNKITKMNYTLDDVLKLKPLRLSYKNTELEIFTFKFLEDIRKGK